MEGIESYTVVHLTASRFYGGPERQILGLAEELRATCRTVVASFREEGLSRQLLCQAALRGIESRALNYDTPRFSSAIREIIQLLKLTGSDVLVCHGYKATLLGSLAARRAHTRVVSVSRGWTGESRRVKLYEKLERLALRYVDRVICVSQAQAEKVRALGVRGERVKVIPNAIRTERFAAPQPARRRELESLFETPPRFIVGAAGRLSPEKGFDVLVATAARILRRHQDVGFVVFGHGPCEAALRWQIRDLGIDNRFILGGFTDDLDEVLPCCDLFALSSHTEGLPNVVLEASACGVPVVATAVGGTPEAISPEVTGLLVPPADPERLAEAIERVLSNPTMHRAMKIEGPKYVASKFTFQAQAVAYKSLFTRLVRQEPSLAHE